MGKSCKMCEYWDEIGRCRRQAPTAIPQPTQTGVTRLYVLVWPKTEADDWCGEFKLRND